MASQLRPMLVSKEYHTLLPIVVLDVSKQYHTNLPIVVLDASKEYHILLLIVVLDVSSSLNPFQTMNDYGVLLEPST